LLDYQLGKHIGTDFLYWLRVMKSMTAIPVVMFSGSTDSEHVAECYEAGANLFLNKPTGLERLKPIVQALHTSVRCQVPSVIFRLKEYQPDYRGNQCTVPN
jgi:DNA-binding response OmpR family regulator